MKLLLILICLAVIAAAARDLHCGATSAGADTIVLACRAGRL